jgi:hypothetical protein
MKRRKFADGGETTEMRPSAKPEGGRFDEDTYSRARRFVESKKEEAKSTPKPAAKPAAKPASKEETSSSSKADAFRASERGSKRSEDTDKPAAKPAPKNDTAKSVSERFKEFRERARTGSTGTDTRSVNERIFGSKPKAEEAPTKRAEIPTASDGPKAPASTGEDTSGPSNMGRILAATGATAGVAGLGKLAYNATRPANRIAEAIKAAKIGGKSTTPIVQSAKSAERYSPKQQMEAAESTMRGAVNRAGLQKNRAELGGRFQSKGGPGKESKVNTEQIESTMRGAATREALRRKRAESAPDLDYKKGGAVKKYAAGGSVGSASRRADGIATKGKTKCRIV